MIMVHQYRFINCNKCTTLVGDVRNGGGYACVGQRVYGKSIKRKTIESYNIICLWSLLPLVLPYNPEAKYSQASTRCCFLCSQTTYTCIQFWIICSSEVSLAVLSIIFVYENKCSMVNYNVLSNHTVVETSSSSVCYSNTKHCIFWPKDSKSLIKQK